VRGGVVALTRADLADAARRARTRAEVATLLAGSFMDGAEMIEVAAPSGAGLDELRAALLRLIDGLPPARRVDFARLPIDRVFRLKGYGTVVTGTLVSGVVETGSGLELLPEGTTVRVRRVQVHGQEVGQAEAGQRTALNLTGDWRRPPARGDLLAASGRLVASPRLATRLELLASAPVALGDGDEVRLHLGTAQRQARVRILEAGGEIPACGSGLVEVRLREPLACTAGDRFILRRPSPARTLGGGVILDPAPPPRHRGDPSRRERWLRLEGGGEVERLEALLDGAGAAGLPLPVLVLRTGLPMDRIASGLRAASAHGVELAGEGAAAHALGAAAAAAVARAMREVLGAFHADRNLTAGMAIQELRRRAAPRLPAALVDRMIGQGVAQGELVATSKGVALATHRVALPAAEIEVLDRLTEAMRAAGLDPPDPWRLLAAEGIGAPRVEALLRLLRERGDLVRVAERILVHREAIAALKRSLYERRDGEPWLDVAAFKALTGTSRRMAIPLLEFLDAERVTARRGDRRLILEPPRGAA